MRLKIIILIALLECFSVFTWAQDNFSDTIPYQLSHNKIILSLKINGKEAKVIYDSGGKPWIIRSEAERLGIAITGQTAVSDMNLKTSWLNKGNIAEIVLSKNFKRLNQEAIIGPNTGSFKSLGVAGLINNEVFNDAVVTILPKLQKIVLTKFRPAWAKKTDGIGVKSLGNHAFMLPLQIGRKTTEAMFDTGYDGLLVVGDDMFARSDSTEFKKINTLFGINGIGINGIPAPSTYYKLLIPEFKLGQKTFINYGTISHALARNVIGIALLKYGNVVLDVPRQVFYFYPFEQIATSLDGAPETWDLQVLPLKKDYFQISGIWGAPRKDVAFGDKVVGINGKSLVGVSPSQLEVMKLMNGIKTSSAYLTIEKAGKQVKVPMRLVK